MKKSVSILATLAFLFSINVSAQQETKQKNKKAKCQGNYKRNQSYQPGKSITFWVT